MSGRFSGRVALVTGATRGIGAAIVRRLAAEGGQVAFCGRSASEGAALAAELGAGDRGHFIAADLTDPAACAAVVDETVARFGRLDLLVNNAASVARGTLESTSLAAFDAQVALNLRAPFLLAQRALPTFKGQHEREGAGGAVINIGSINAYIGVPQLAVYSATKGALMTLSKNLAHALSPWRIRVHVLNVGWTLTEGEEAVQRHEGAPADWAAQAGATRPWGRLLSADEVAAAVAFFAAPEAAVFSGAAVDLEQFPVGRPCE